MHPDQLVSQKSADLNLHCIQNRITVLSGLSMVRVNIKINSVQGEWFIKFLNSLLCSSFITLVLGSIHMDCMISEPCYKGTIST